MLTINLLVKKRMADLEDVVQASCKGIRIMPHGGEKPVVLAPQHDYERSKNEPAQEYCRRCYEIADRYAKHGLKVIE